MRAAVVILNWNTKEYLRSFLPPLLSSLGEEDLLVVADNASTDGSLTMLAEEFPSVKTIALDTNYGFTGGYNRALSQIDAQYYVLINSDILVEDGWLEPLLSFMEDHPECGLCGPKLKGLVKSEGKYIKTDTFEYAGAAGGFLDRFGFPFCRGRVLGRVCKDSGQYDAPTHVLWSSGACLMVRSNVWKALGGLDDRFFAHMEEIDLCWRAQLKGYSVCNVPQSTVWHLGGGTLSPKSAFKLELNYRNNLLLLNNNLRATYLASGMSDKKADRRAQQIITLRLAIDNLTRLIYFLEGKLSYAGAVRKAHAAYKLLRLQPSPSTGEVETGAKTAEAKAVASEATTATAGAVVGIIPINIIPQAIFRGKGIFNFLDKKIFKPKQTHNL